MNKQNYFVFAGLIGVGKTTCAATISEKYNLNLIEEPQLNNTYMGNILQDFYNNMERYAFSLQIFLLNERYEQIEKITSLSISDRSIYEDQIFCNVLYKNGKIEQREYDCYVKTRNKLIKNIKPPIKLIYLKCSPETAFERIKNRVRKEESNISFEYIKDLSNGYNEFFSDTKTLEELNLDIEVIDYNKFNDLPIELIHNLLYN